MISHIFPTFTTCLRNNTFIIIFLYYKNLNFYFSSFFSSSISISSIEILYPVNFEAKLTFKPFFQTAFALSVGSI
ncbi:hypothetical protein HOG27_04195 [bacterium]|nr:hypothetical protein [bacterium]